MEAWSEFLRDLRKKQEQNNPLASLPVTDTVNETWLTNSTKKCLMDE